MAYHLTSEEIKARIPYVRSQARRYARYGSTQDQEDAEQCAWLGVLRAAELWDESRGIPFWGYAQYSIRKYASRGGRILRNPMRVPERALGVYLDTHAYDEDLEDLATPEDLLGAMHTRRRAENTLRLLSDIPDIDLVLAIEVEGRSYVEMANELGLSRQRVHQRYQRAYDRAIAAVHQGAPPVWMRKQRGGGRVVRAADDKWRTVAELVERGGLAYTKDRIFHEAKRQVELGRLERKKIDGKYHYRLASTTHA